MLVDAAAVLALGSLDPPEVEAQRGQAGVGQACGTARWSRASASSRPGRDGGGPAPPLPLGRRRQIGLGLEAAGRRLVVSRSSTAVVRPWPETVPSRRARRRRAEGQQEGDPRRAPHGRVGGQAPDQDDVTTASWCGSAAPEGERRSTGGILIPATAQMGKRLTWAEVVATGPNVRQMEPGDHVLFNPEDRYEVEVRGEDFVILRERDVHAVAASRLEEGSTGSVPVTGSRPGGWRLYDDRAMPAVTPIAATDEQLAAVTFDADGLVPAIVQEEGTGQRADDGVDERRVAAPLARDGTHVVLEPVAARSSGARARPPATASTSARPPTTATATCCCSSSSRRATAPATRATTPASSGPSGPGPERGRRRVGQPRPAPSSTRWPPSYTVVPVWRELLADLITPVAAFARLCRDDEPGFLLESVEHGERWSRWSFVGRRAAATFTARGREVTVDGTGCPDSIPLDQGILAADRGRPGLLPRAGPRRPAAAAQRPRWATSATTSCARSSTCPTCRPTISDLPDAVLSIIGELAAFDHFRQRVTLVANVLDPGRRHRRRPRPGLRRSRRPPRPARPSTAPARSTSPWSSRRSSTTSCPRSRRRWARRPTGGRSRWPRSTSWPATSSRSCCRSGSTSTSTPTRSTSTGCCARSTRARTCTSCACPS